MENSATGSESVVQTRSAKPLGSYLLSKCIVGYGVINGIINAVIFYAIHASDPGVLLGEPDLLHDLAFTGALLGALLFIIVVPLTRADVRKQVFEVPDPARMAGGVSLAPAVYAPALLVTAVVAVVVILGVGALATLFVPMPLSITAATLLKGVACACAGGMAGYFTICYVIRSTQRTA